PRPSLGAFGRAPALLAPGRDVRRPSRYGAAHALLRRSPTIPTMNANPAGITHRLRGAAEWRLSALKSRVRTIRSDDARDYLRGWLQRGFVFAPLDTMQ